MCVLKIHPPGNKLNYSSFFVLDPSPPILCRDQKTIIPKKVRDGAPEFIRENTTARVLLRGRFFKVVCEQKKERFEKAINSHWRWIIRDDCFLFRPGINDGRK